MNDQLFSQIKLKLYDALKTAYGLEGPALDTLVEKGQSALKSTMLAHVSKNGTKEAEDIICSRIDYRQSELRKTALEALEKGISGLPELGGNSARSVAETSVDTLLENMQKAFADSGKSKDTKGVSEFIGIDPMLLKMVNSSVGKLFGKFIK